MMSPAHLRIREYGRAERLSNSSGPQLVSVEAIPSDGEMCEWVPAAAHLPLNAVIQNDTSVTAGRKARPTREDRAPVRVIRDTYPTYSAIAVDTRSNEVFLQDENLYGIKVFNRLDNT